jgi:acylphosphatase
MMSESAAQQRVARRAVIVGRVQGVWFRDSARRCAESLEVAGWARNRVDGTVEVWAEGQRDAVEALLDYCRMGPPRAVVEHLAVEEVTPTELDDFEVR